MVQIQKPPILEYAPSYNRSGSNCGQCKVCGNWMSVGSLRIKRYANNGYKYHIECVSLDVMRFCVNTNFDLTGFETLLKEDQTKVKTTFETAIKNAPPPIKRKRSNTPRARNVSPRTLTPPPTPSTGPTCLHCNLPTYTAPSLTCSCCSARYHGHCAATPSKEYIVATEGPWTCSTCIEFTEYPAYYGLQSGEGGTVTPTRSPPDSVSASPGSNGSGRSTPTNVNPADGKAMKVVTAEMSMFQVVRESEKEEDVEEVIQKIRERQRMQV